MPAKALAEPVPIETDSISLPAEGTVPLADQVPLLAGAQQSLATETVPPHSGVRPQVAPPGLQTGRALSILYMFAGVKRKANLRFFLELLQVPCFFLDRNSHIRRWH
mgnify:CR=1 FL=1